MTGWKLNALVAVLALSLLGNALTLGGLLRLRQAREAMLGDSAAITLPREMRRELGATLYAHRADLAPAIRAVQAARGQAVQAVTARPYDAAKAREALDGLRTALDALMAQGEEVVLAKLGP